MAINKFWNIGKANAEIANAHAAADPILTNAKISVIKVDGKDVPATEAGLAEKITSIGSLVATGDKSQDVSELIATNGLVAAEAEKLKTENVTATATVAAQAQKISTLESELSNERAAVQKLTAEVTSKTVALKASNDEAVRLSAINNEHSTELSAQCIAANCLDLKGEDGKPLAKDASNEQKISAANKLPFAERMSAFKGAVNAAMAKTGVAFGEIPTMTPGATQPQQAKYKNSTELCKAAVEAEKAGKPVPQYVSFGKKN